MATATWGGWILATTSSLAERATVLWSVAGGVVIAWLLQRYTERRKHRRLRRALEEECRALLAGQVPQFIDLFSRISANLARRLFLPGLAVRAMSTVYREAIRESTRLTMKERNLLHVVHERLRVGDGLLKIYDNYVRAAQMQGVPDHVWENERRKMTDQIESYRVVAEFLESFLRGESIDVFHVDVPDAVRRTALYEPVRPGISPEGGPRRPPDGKTGSG